MKKRILHLLLGELLLLGMVLAAISIWPATQTVARAEGFANQAFQTTWSRTDAPVASGAAIRPYVWGQAPFAVKTERYENSPDKQRLVQYFDKGRMEITHPEGDASNPWYVSSGLLVRDMLYGIVQVGDNLAQLYDPVQIPVAGDEQDPSNTAPLYSDFLKSLSLGRNSPLLPLSGRVGKEITLTFARGGKTGNRASNAEPKISVAYYDSSSQHNIAAPFWDFMNASGPVSAPNGQVVTGPLFEWQYILGYPLSEPFWIMATSGGKSQELLVQLFERRVLVFNPSAPADQRVDFTDIGRHWFNWQYGPASVYSGDTSVPPSVNATIRPAYGDEDTIFNIKAEQYRPGEKVALDLTLPDGTFVSSNELGYLEANPKGEVVISFPGSALMLPGTDNLGIYRLDFKGVQSAQQSTVFWRIIPKVPKTPTTPYSNDNSPAPPSVNAAVEPSSGPVGTNFTAFVTPFQAKEMAAGKVVYWITTPEGEVYGANAKALLSTAQEALDGTLLALGSPPSPGIWAITLAYADRSSVQSIIYIKVTDAPPEVTIANALNVFRVPLAAGGRNNTPWQPTYTWQTGQLAAQLQSSHPEKSQPEGEAGDAQK